MKHIYLFLITLFIGSFGFGQTTVTYNFSGGVTGLNVPSPGITVDSDPNIGFGSFKNSGTSNPALNSGQLRLYQNATKGGSIKIYANNGVTITDITVNASGRTGPAGYTVDGDTATNLNATSTYTISGISATSEVEFYQRSSDSGDRIYVDSFTVTYIIPVTCTAPTTQASAYNTTALGTTSATLNWTSGDGDEVLVLVKEGSAVDEDPTNGTTYAGDTVFGYGDQLGTENYVVHSDSATSSVSITDLSEATTYHVAVYEYNTTDTCYLTPALTGSFTTGCSTPSDVTAFTADEGNEEIDLTWTNGSCYDEILVIAKETSAVTVTPTGDGAAYTADAAFGSGTDLGTGEYVVYKGTGTSVTVTGLTNGTTYHFEVFARKASTWSSGVTANAVPDLTWCTVSGTTTFDTSITLVNFGTINKSSGQGSGYDDFTAESTDAIQGSDIDLTVNLNTDGAYTIYAKAWIDWNQDGTFDTSTEEYALGTANDETDGPTTLSPLTISVPAGATLGNTRMRVVCQYDSNPEPCAGSTDGEIEDYTINVVAALNNDTDTEVYEPTSQVATATITAASSTTSGTAFDALGFVVEDYGSGDTEPTNITTMRFVPGPNNTADWTDHIQGVTLSDENAVSYAPTTSITDTEIVLTFGSPVVIADGTSLEFLLGLYLNETAIVDGSVIQLQINESASGFETNITGSGLADPFLLGDVVGNDITINVDATELVFSEQASDTELNAAMSPAVTVSGVDANGNLDTDYNLDVDITSTGTLSGSTVTATAVSGVATFSTLTHTIVGSGLVLTADDGALATIDSSPFDITEPIVGAADLFFSEYIEGNTGNNKYLEIYNGTGTTITLTDYSVEMYANGNSSASQTEDFTGGFPTTLASGDVIVLQAQNTSEFTGTAYDSGVCYFNGNDTVVLKKHGIIIDIIGNIGCDPGSAFTASGGFSTANKTLVRNTDVCEGVSIDPSDCGSTSFTTLATEWTSLGTDVFSNLGTHTAMCGPPTTYTYNGTWSPSDPIGSATANDDIIIATGDVTLVNTISVNTITVNPGASLTLNSGITLTATVITLKSDSNNYSSLISNGTISGPVYYERFVNTIGSGATSNPGNDLISLPLMPEGLTFDSFISNGSNADEIAENGTYYAFAPYNNANMNYENFLMNGTQQLTKGKGYRVATTSGENLTFTGAPDNNTISIEIETPASGSPWNLIGNPYPSYINARAFLSHNASIFDTSATAIYAYNSNTYNGVAPTTGNFTIINIATIDTFINENFNIAPGQGFFVVSNAIGGHVEFIPEMCTVNGNDDYIAGRDANSFEYFKLNLTGTSTYSTNFIFNDNASLGLDPGYDAAVFAQTPEQYPLFSHLVEDNTGLPIALQSLNTTNLSNVSIPLGVNTNQGETITFNIDSAHLPESTLVYLEDTVTNSYTLLNTNDYVLTPNSNITGTGRFYLHLSSNTLSLQDNAITALNIYTNTADQTIVISGRVKNKTTATIYDMQGRKVVQRVLNINESVQTIDTNHMVKGIYVIDLSNKTQSKTQKIIIN
ncbi:GEVED domain-containing protein [Winogradskyella arenosi]|uniref:Putative secreted protein (Por secretion system target) n=1 Tax=Winogradskyella arenosi TaxID=533325 RepID=A0A368ZBM9_9FLAO|nr:GEVED domain-containing protein [Winogradskyella arenosi]RCW90270.1 putative secreted protein (Por secretion system target) [Winogradskyella arenosi]